MPRRSIQTLGTAILLVSLAGCAASVMDPARSAASASAAPESVASPTASPTTAPADEQIVGTILRFTSDRTSVDVTIGEDNATVRDLLALLPMEVSLEEFNGREKIAYPVRQLETAGAPGSDPENGDLIYFSPWGNLGFYYNADGIGFSDDTIHIGTYTATPDQLALLEGGRVTIEVLK